MSQIRIGGLTVQDHQRTGWKRTNARTNIYNDNENDNVSDIDNDYNDNDSYSYFNIHGTRGEWIQKGFTTGSAWFCFHNALRTRVDRQSQHEAVCPKIGRHFRALARGHHGSKPRQTGLNTSATIRFYFGPINVGILLANLENGARIYSPPSPHTRLLSPAIGDLHDSAPMDISGEIHSIIL